MTDHFKQIYTSQAEMYDALVSQEDYQQNLLPALSKIYPLRGAEIVEFGAGTGRLTLLLAPLVKSIRAFDESAHMLEMLNAKLTKAGITNCEVAVADNRKLPIADESADIAMEGWSFGHFCGWYHEHWRQEIEKALDEMQRLLRPGGAAILLETLGTGRETPQPPTPELADFYRWLQTEKGFEHSWIRTDYRFTSLTQAEQLTRFFFGSELADTVVANNLVILPECTGLWWRHKTV